MKLQNQSLKYLSISILGIVILWGIIFYINTLNEIKGSIDEGLENYKRLIIQNAKKDSSILDKSYFDESFFSIQRMTAPKALAQKDQYIDTEIYMQDADDEEPEPEPVRMLITAFEINGKYYQLKVANSMVEEDDLINELMKGVILLYSILITSIIAINLIVLKKLWQPFYKLLDQLKGFRLGYHQELPEINTKTKEFADLKKVMDNLLKHTIKTYEQQNQFIGNASHELQTPLAIVSNNLELVLENKTLENSDAKKITETYQIAQRLIRLNKSLLLLAKIENNQFMGSHNVSINTIVAQTIDDLKEIIEFKNIKITIRNTAELSVMMDKSLANILISNLIRNAVLHNVKNGKIDIAIMDETLKISNYSMSQKLNDTNIFRRFYKATGKPNSTGLGLSMVKAITELYGFSISYTHENDLHCFELTFK
ncbi:sensor histidine kinase [Muricauda sp. TY007]|uniref:sensor histidine kinase n=1 Tax=Allomuricauda sp. TY007 TaxID=2683200 RepID=UPI0013BF8120|nr:HAMP domain-containing sensor histidine kinase [Muricauda sp. TY007]NDV16337.1 sensor histidine kinase [Muricauda sp. TY007]